MSSASVVTLLRVKRAEPCTRGPDAPCKYADTYEPACTAFALRRAPSRGGGAGAVLLVTAAHCTPYPLGSELRYYAPNGVGHDRALLVARDVVRAVLEPRDASALVPLERGPVPDEGERVSAVSSLYDVSAPGSMAAELTVGWYETTQTIVFGWSGAPELDARGRVWGLVSKCPLDEQARCMAGHTYVTDLSGL